MTSTWLAAGGSSVPSDLGDVFRDLYAHPELAFAEIRTAAIVAAWLTRCGYDVTTGVGGTGVVGVLPNGTDPTALLRADMDGLPVSERTGLANASTSSGLDETGAEAPVMHACGHDVHVTCLLGAVERLAAERATWAGTLLVVFRPAEEAATCGCGCSRRSHGSCGPSRPRPGLLARPRSRSSSRPRPW